ncbi:MAG: TadE/TadG family type IV pilus assembly protein [Planctomycetaceae bacterium]
MSIRPSTDRSRRGVAAVEFAVCLPVLVLVVFGSIEACTMVFLKESLTVAAYEGSRLALQPTATEADVITRCQEVLTDRKVQAATVQLTPSVLSSVPGGDSIEILVSAPCGSNAVIPVWFYGGTTLTGRSTVMKEY